MRINMEIGREGKSKGEIIKKGENMKVKILKK